MAKLKNISFGTEMLNQEEVIAKLNELKADIDTYLQELRSDVDLNKTAIGNAQTKLKPGTDIGIAPDGTISYTGANSSITKEEVERKISTKQDKLLPGPGIAIGQDGKTISSSPWVDIDYMSGYYNSSDGMFYAHPNLDEFHRMQGMVGIFYTDLNTGSIYLYKSNEEGFVTTPFVSQAYIDQFIKPLATALSSFEESILGILN